MLISELGRNIFILVMRNPNLNMIRCAFKNVGFASHISVVKRKCLVILRQRYEYECWKADSNKAQSSRNAYCNFRMKSKGKGYENQSCQQIRYHEDRKVLTLTAKF